MTFSQMLKWRVVIETNKSNIDKYFLKKRDNSMIGEERFEPYVSIHL